MYVLDLIKSRTLFFLIILNKHDRCNAALPVGHGLFSLLNSSFRHLLTLLGHFDCNLLSSLQCYFECKRLKQQVGCFISYRKIYLKKKVNIVDPDQTRSCPIRIYIFAISLSCTKMILYSKLVIKF